MIDIASDVQQRFAGLAPLKPTQICWLKERGVPAAAIAQPEMLAYARVVFRRETSFFDFVDDVDEDVDIGGAMIVLARHQFGEPWDLVAWSPRTGRLATWIGSDLPVLGWHMVFPPRLDLGDALTVHPTPLEWLRDCREGVVILKPERARFYLEGFSLKVENAAFGRGIRNALRWPEPKIFVEARERAAA